MRRLDHTHDCRSCGQPFPCDGTYERNYDGFPEAICDLFHVRGFDWCEDCRERDWNADEDKPAASGPDGFR